MSTIKLYHSSIYFLDSFNSQSLTLIKSVKNLSNHLWERIDNSNQKRYNIDVAKLYLILNAINESNCHPFEVETTDGIVTKCVIRYEYDESRNISIVVRDGFVLTSWLNQKNDFHATLDRSKYEGGR